MSLRRWRAALLLLLPLAACDSATPPADPTTCDLANDRFGTTVCEEAILDEATWLTLSVEADVIDQARAVKYLVPVAPDRPLPAMFVNSQRYALHYDFLREVFPEHYGELGWMAYVAMIIEPDRRDYWGGDVSEYIEVDGSHRFGFIVWDDPAVPSSAPTYEEVLTVWRELQPRFALGDLAFSPSSSAQREAVVGWTDAPFPIRGESNVTYEAYTVAAGFGTVRFQSLATLAEDSTAGAFGYQDLLVLDEAPMDLDRVVSGVVTGSRQAALSHLNVRMSSRGTPNCFTAEPWTRLAAWEGQLVRLECGADRLDVRSATAAEASAWWEALRPAPVAVPAPDLDWPTPLPLLEVPTADAEERAAALARFGAKGANLATLYQRIGPEVQLDGFVVPFSYYDRFVRENGWSAPVAGGTAALTFADTLVAWHADPEFLADSGVRAERLAALREAMLAAPVAPEDLSSVADAIRAAFGTDTIMLRFRSSSNAEDGLEFSGAGLYESASACLADDLDADEAGPSACDDDKSSEKSIESALRTVWASLWATGAWEEREWYGIDQLGVAMAVLVNDQAEGERANLVAFTGNPLGSSPGWLVEAQVGDLDVVSAEAGITPERSLLTVEAGEVVDIVRLEASSEVDPGFAVLSDAQLGAVGSLLWEVDGVMPWDHPDDGAARVWDTEQKVLADGRLIIKQVRPFVGGDAAP